MRCKNNTMAVICRCFSAFVGFPQFFFYLCCVFQDTGILQRYTLLYFHSATVFERYRTVSGPDTIGSFFYDPLMFFLRKICQFFLSNCDLQCFSFSRLQKLCFCIPNETAIFFLYLCLRKRCINLHNFFSCISISDISNFHFNCKFFLRSLNPFEFYFKLCIGQSESKRKQWLFTKAIKITVSDKNPFFVLFGIQISIQITVILCKRAVFISSRPGCRQFRTWYTVSQQDVCNRISTLLPRLGNIKDCLYVLCIFQNVSQFDRTTRIQKQDDRNLFFIQEKKICCFSFTQIIVSFYPAAVFTLSGNTAEHIHSCFCICDILCFNSPSFRKNKRVACVCIKWIIYVLCILKDFFFPDISCVFITFFIILQPVLAGNSHTCFFHSLINGNIFSVIYITGTNSAFNSLFCPTSKQCNS